MGKFETKAINDCIDTYSRVHAAWIPGGNSWLASNAREELAALINAAESPTAGVLNLGVMPSGDNDGRQWEYRIDNGQVEVSHAGFNVWSKSCWYYGEKSRYYMETRRWVAARVLEMHGVRINELVDEVSEQTAKRLVALAEKVTEQESQIASLQYTIARKHGVIVSLDHKYGEQEKQIERLTQSAKRWKAAWRASLDHIADCVASERNDEMSTKEATNEAK